MSFKAELGFQPGSEEDQLIAEISAIGVLDCKQAGRE